MGKESDLYDPLNTKTIGGELRLDVDTYENVQDNIHLESVNRKLLELTDLVGRVTNNRSSSGPIPGTLKIVTTTGTSAGNNIAFQPAAGEVWELTAASFGAVGSGSWRGILALKDLDGNYVELVDKSTSGTGQSLDFSTPIFITNNVYLEFTIVTVDTSLSVKAAVIRVR